MYVGTQYLLRTLTWLKSVAWSHLLTVAAKFLCTITHVATISSCVCGELVKISDETKRHYQSIHLSAKQMAALNALVVLGLLAEKQSLVQYEYFSVYISCSLFL